MTKHDYIDELKRTRADIEGDFPYSRGERAALDYAIDVAKGIRSYVPYKYSRNVNVSLTKEQARRVLDLLGDGPLDRLIKDKIGRAWK